MANNNSPKNADKALAYRLMTLFVILLGLAVISLFITFRGLSSPRAMEQAQIGKELASGNGYSTKVIRPAAIWQIKQNGKEPASFNQFPETYHAPLNPLIYGSVIKAVQGNDTQKWRMPKNSNIYGLDRIIAATCTLFFIAAIGVNYLLISRIFDNTIAFITAILLMFCQLMWQFAQSGLPQMLMLLLFSLAMLHLWKAIEKTQENKSFMSSILIAGFFMCLLALTHWITIWIYIGFTVFCAIFFKPKGVVATILIGMLAVVVLPITYFIYTIPSGSSLGMAFYAIHDGLGFSEDYLLRSLSPEDQQLGLQGLFVQIISSTLSQLSSLYGNLGSILVAPLFFISLIHPFRNKLIRSFRWLILLMVFFASIGMTLYGTRDGVMDSNQIIILFTPLMTAYGLAMLAILWAKVQINQSMQILRNAHFIIIIFISIGPMLFSLPLNLKRGLSAGKVGIPHTPFYYPPSLNRLVADNTSEDELIISDTPWAVAWYANRPALWLPHNLDQIKAIETIAQDLGSNISGIHITPYSFSSDPIIRTAGANGQYKALFPLVYGAWAAQAKAPNFLASHPDFNHIKQNYKYPVPLLYANYMTFYSKEAFSATAR